MPNVLENLLKHSKTLKNLLKPALWLGGVLWIARARDLLEEPTVLHRETTGRLVFFLK